MHHKHDSSRIIILGAGISCLSYYIYIYVHIKSANVFLLKMEYLDSPEMNENYYIE